LAAVSSVHPPSAAIGEETLAIATTAASFSPGAPVEAASRSLLEDAITVLFLHSRHNLPPIPFRSDSEHSAAAQ
jgi:hypothetical protein